MKHDGIRLADVDQQPIVAQCTPQGSGALCIIRISGQGSLELVDKITKLSSGNNVVDLPGGRFVHGFIYDHSEVVDEVMIAIMRNPKSFTGQDTIEITCHNNLLIIERIIQLTLQKGARLAQPGEFARRAVLNDKLDLVQAEAIHDVITASTQAGLKLSMAQLQGSLSGFVQKVGAKILRVLSVLEASFEFLEEEHLDLDMDAMVCEELEAVAKFLQSLQAGVKNQHKVVQGIKIVVVGPPNAGKSTLFNSLVQQDRAIVSDVAGTTRDSIESLLHKKGQLWSLVDTAGIRDSEDSIESAGVVRSWQQLQEADVVILVLDGSQNLKESAQKSCEKIIQNYTDRLIVGLNKVDLVQNASVKSFIAQQKVKFLPVSAKSHLGMEELEAAVEARVKAIFDANNSPFLLNQRQQKLVLQAEKELQEVIKLFKQQQEPEVLTLHLRQTLAALQEITGQDIKEQAFDDIFKGFCIGK